jgi:hypothetical protein
VRSSSPPLLTSFLLRAPQVVLAAGIALAANGIDSPRGRWVVRGLAVLLALRLMPPTDFFTGASGDPNYRQMMLLTLAGLGLVTVAMLLARVSPRAQADVLFALLVIGLVGGWVGLSRAEVLLDNFEMEVQLGLGVVVWSAALVLLGYLLIESFRRERARI